MNTPALKTVGRSPKRPVDRVEKEYDEEQFQPGSYGCHELLDRTSVTAEIIERYILSHPACLQNQEWMKLAEQAVEALNSLYQKIGATHLDESGEASDSRV
jgi:hypothetical protein